MVMLETVQRIANESNSTVSFFVKAAAQTITDGGWRKITLGTEIFDEGSNFASSKFTAPSSGIYFFSGAIHINLSAGERFVTSLYKNGSEVLRGTDNGVGGTTEAAGVVSGILKLVATDYIELYTYYDGDGDTTTKENTGLTYLCGYLVGIT